MSAPENQKGEPEAVSAASESSLKPGMLLSGRYVIEKELGRGGIGVVYLARDQQLLSRPVVVKVLLEKSYQDDWIKKKFIQEMEALVRMNHPGIVNVYDAGEMADGKPYLVMQYIDGTSLRQSLGQPMPLTRVGRLVGQIAQALGAAHDKGVFHRDLKPENIMIHTASAGLEEAKLIDFGLAKVHDSKVGESSVVPNVAGSFGYMAPEQLLSRPATAASDTYALAVIAYEMITGRRPFQPESVFELYEMQRRGGFSRPCDLCPSLPQPVESLILKALSFDPKDRPAAAREFGNQFTRALGSSAETIVHRDISLPEAPAATAVSTVISTPFSTGNLLAASCAGLNLILLSGAVKVSFYRFVPWKSSLMQAPVLLLLPAAAILLFFGFRKAFSATGALARKAGVAAGLGLAVLLGWAIIQAPPVIRISSVSGVLREEPDLFTINYSDPKGYKYTLVESRHCFISVNPGGFNELKDYTIKITLTPDVEFADVYFDRNFHLREPLLLQPSNTNDILLLSKKDDHFIRNRTIKFSYKYRTAPQNNHVTVSLKTGEQDFSYDAEIKL